MPATAHFGGGARLFIFPVRNFRGSVANRWFGSVGAEGFRGADPGGRERSLLDRHIGVPDVFRLGAGVIWFCWRRLKLRAANRLLLIALGSLIAAAFAGLGVYLGAFATTTRSLPAGEIPYSHHHRPDWY